MQNKGSLIVAVILCLATLIAVHAQASLDVLESSLTISLSPAVVKTVPFQVHNTGTTNINLVFDTSQLDLTDSKGDTISLTFSPAAPSLIPNETQTMDMVLQADPTISFENFGGTLVVKDQSTSAQDTLTLNIQVAPDVCDFGQVGTDLNIDIKEPDSSDEFKPGDTIPVEVEVDNRGRNDVRVQVEAFLFNDNRNIADTSSRTRLIQDGEDETFTLSLEIPLESEDIDEDDKLTLFVKAFDDEFEQLNCVQDEQDVDIKLEKDDIVIDEEETRLFPQVAACGDVVSAFVKVVNIGDDDNDNVAISIINTQLSINEKSETFNLEAFNSKEDNSAIRQFQLPIPGNIRTGKYTLDVKATFDGGSDAVKLPLEIASCGLFATVAGTTAPVEIRVAEERFTVQPGTVIPVPITVTNNQLHTAIFIISITNSEDFAESSTKTITLKPGTQTTTFINMVVKAGAQLGVYSATVLVKEGAAILASQNVQVEVGEAEGGRQAAAISPFVAKIPTSVWIIGNIFLLAVAILAVKVVITALKQEERGKQQ